MWSEAPAETSFTEAGSEVPSAAISADGSIGEAPAETSFTEAGSEVPSAAVSADGSIGEAPGIDLLSEGRKDASTKERDSFYLCAGTWVERDRKLLIKYEYFTTKLNFVPLTFLFPILYDWYLVWSDIVKYA